MLGAVGLWLRGFAAGYLHKQEILTVTGPYAYTRNPLYLGSAILALGVGLATNSWISGAIIFAYFALFYSMVMRGEEKELHLRHGAAFEEYARTVPLFFPRIRAAKLPGASPGAFSWAQYRKNHEWRAAVGFLLLLGVLLAISAFRHHEAAAVALSGHATKQLTSSRVPFVNTWTAPSRSVRRIRMPAFSSRCKSSVLGCPKGLSSPAEIIPTRGLTAARNSDVEEFLLPWWPTFRTSACISPASSSASIARSASLSASPVSMIPRPRYFSL
jgi:hypothetical protein